MDIPDRLDLIIHTQLLHQHILQDHQVALRHQDQTRLLLEVQLPDQIEFLHQEEEQLLLPQVRELHQEDLHHLDQLRHLDLLQEGQEIS